MIVMGIDPGKKGGIAVLNGEKLIYSALYTMEHLRFALQKYTPEKVWLEKVHAMPNQGVTSMFHFGQGFGEIIGMCYAFGYSEESETLQLVRPQDWKGFFWLIGCDKKESIKTAKARFKNVTFMATKRSRNPSDGMAESALIGLYGYCHDTGTRLKPIGVDMVSADEYNLDKIFGKEF